MLSGSFGLNNRNILGAASVFGMLLALSLTAHAGAMDFTGELDPFTGYPVGVTSPEAAAAAAAAEAADPGLTPEAQAARAQQMAAEAEANAQAAQDAWEAEQAKTSAEQALKEQEEAQKKAAEEAAEAARLQEELNNVQTRGSYDGTAVGAGEYSFDYSTGQTSYGSTDYFDYSGEIDPFSGMPYGSASDPGQASDGPVVISDSTRYDRAMGMYAYPLTSVEGYVYADAADGMLTTGSVKVYYTDAVLRVYKDGTLYEESVEELTEPGTYLFRELRGETETTLFQFTILPAATNNISGYLLPRGFSMVSVNLNGQPARYEPGYVSMEEEGSYQIAYACERIGRTYVLEVQVDRTPPSLFFTNLNEKMRARGQVEMTGLQEGESVLVVLNGREINVNDNTFKESGNYVVVARDPAGNESEYRFTILLYLNLQGTLFAVFFVVCIAGVFVYLILQSKRFRVR